MEHHLEARLWNDVFKLAQDYIAIPRGTIRGTVLIETITAVFHVRPLVCAARLTRQMDEIIFELKEHSSGLNCGRWDCSSISTAASLTAQTSSRSSRRTASSRASSCPTAAPSR